MTSVEPPICITCIHWHESDHEHFTCDAYPDGIPMEIVYSDADHHYPFAKDNGIRFEPKEQSSAKGSAGKLGG